MTSRMVPPAILYNGRVETYTHSDGTTQNKGCCIIRIDCQSEFGAKVEAFKAFCKHAAMLCYGAQSEIWADVIAMFPDLEQERLKLEEVMKEKITIKRIVIVTLVQDVWVKPEEKLSKVLEFMKAKRVDMPLFETSSVTEPADMAIVNEVRYAPIEREESLLACEENDGCDNCDACKDSLE
jgi:translation elongation factor EF-Ts